MAWNRTQTTDLPIAESKAMVGPGAPVVHNASMVGRPYKDGWDIERAYREGVQKVTWVFRCIDAIAGNQAKLPIRFRKDNSPFGEIVTKDSDGILELLNMKANVGEDAFAFRYRLSAQLLMSTRGAFIEKLVGRNGKLIGLSLLPPQRTAPLPHPKTFVSGYQVDMPDGQQVILKPEQVIWAKRPHPLDPYLSLTPMESAGIAIEIENLAKVYNRNYLLNDGRPGGLLVVRGEIDDDDKEELRSRFRGNLNRAGSTTVISADDGVDFVDTSASPRDAAYVQMREITKAEILMAFGVPESVMANASGRTFSNASEEVKVFWMETMESHLGILGRALDQLHPKYFVDFDTDNVPALIMAKQERSSFLLQEFNSGLVSGNEYREGTGRKKIESELMDSMLANPNLTPIGNTEKPFEAEQQAPIDMAAPGAAPQPAPDAAAGAPPATPVIPPTSEDQFTSIPPGAGPAPAGQAPGAPAGEPGPAEELSDSPTLYFKDAKSDQDLTRWTAILDRSLERLFERQERVTLEKGLGAKARKAMATKTLSVDSIFDVDVWRRQTDEDIRPMITTIVTDSYRSTTGQEPDRAKVDEYVDEQMERVQKIHDTTREEILAATLVLALLGDDQDGQVSMLRTALLAIFADLMRRRRQDIAEHEAWSAFNAGVWLGAQQTGARKAWVSERDQRVRPEHTAVDGLSVPAGDTFDVGGFPMRFPGDPKAPPHLTIGCRCKMRLSR